MVPRHDLLLVTWLPDVGSGQWRAAWLTLIVTLLLSVVASAALQASARHLAPNLRHFLTDVARYGIIVAGFAMIFSIMGFQTPAAAVGIAVAAVGFGMNQVVGIVSAGLWVLFSRDVEIGDDVRVILGPADMVEGRVTDVTVGRVDITDDAGHKHRVASSAVAAAHLIILRKYNEASHPSGPAEPQAATGAG